MEAIAKFISVFVDIWQVELINKNISSVKLLKKILKLQILCGKDEKSGGGIQDFPDMQDKELYQKLLGLSTPWSINDVELRMDELKVTVRLIHQTS